MVKLLLVLLFGLLPVIDGLYYRCGLMRTVPGPHPDIPAISFLMSRTLGVGDTIIIKGKVFPDVQAKKRLTIDLLTELSEEYYKSVSTLHFSAQFDLNRTSIGDYKPNANQVFREEKILPLALTLEPFSIRIKVEADGYSIYVDKKFLYKLKYSTDLKESYKTVWRIFLQNVDIHTECIIDCKEDKDCPAGGMTYIISNRSYREAVGTCPE
ncbi:unnamed protein product [Caenorhabditis auriculariae]|uniref:Galectin n=1 Tax=Caenorhabditis auriculariae TaxID=2777116 RepID=A0A8S1HIW1_9PELO|nr:unnamed protein product [Caenorhabditis auriculariae]